jgi:hypothetical protein
VHLHLTSYRHARSVSATGVPIVNVRGGLLGQRVDQEGSKRSGGAFFGWLLVNRIRRTCFACSSPASAREMKSARRPSTSVR